MHIWQIWDNRWPWWVPSRCHAPLGSFYKFLAKRPFNFPEYLPITIDLYIQQGLEYKKPFGEQNSYSTFMLWFDTERRCHELLHEIYWLRKRLITHENGKWKPVHSMRRFPFYSGVLKEQHCKEHICDSMYLGNVWYWSFPTDLFKHVIALYHVSKHYLP